MYQQPPWFGVPVPSSPLSIVEQLEAADKGIEYLETWKKRLSDKDKDKKKDGPPRKSYSSSDVWCLTLLMMFLSPGVGIAMLHFYAYLAGQYALAFKAFTP